MYRILVVDDEEKIRKLIEKYATFEGHEVQLAENGMQALELCRLAEPDIVIMDVMMPELDGFSTVKELRKTSAVPVIMLSARGEEYDRIHGFEIGVDDYVVKPFSPKELMMRIDAVMKRVQSGAGTPAASTHKVYQTGDLIVDFTARKVTLNGESLNFSPKEYDLLFYLVKNRGIALEREKILTQVWGYDFFGDDRTLDTHIKTLRKSLGAYSSHIVTLRGIGYRFDA